MTAAAQAQIVVGDPLNASKTFSSYCSACHKSAAGLAKSANGSTLASFLRQHYTTGPEMSGAMAAYLLSAGGGQRHREDRAAAEKDKKGAAARRHAAKSDPTEPNARQPQAETPPHPAAPGAIMAPERQGRRQSRAALRKSEPPPAAAPAPAAEQSNPEKPAETAPPAPVEAAPPAAPEPDPDYWASSP